MSYRILAVGNNKGGVGKTFISKSIAEYAAIVRGLRVLAIDLDPQTNLSRRYLDMRALSETGDYAPPSHPDFDPENDPPDDEVSDSADIWWTGLAAPYPTAYEKLEIIPAHAHRLQEIEYVRRRDLHEGVLRQLKAFLNHEDIKSEYDLVVLDTRPSKGPLVQAAMHAATHLLIPTQLEAPAVEGLQGMLSQRRLINRDRGMNDQLELVGILPNLVRSVRLHDEYRELVRDPGHLGQAVLPVEINDWVAYRESMRFQAESLFAPRKADRKSRERTVLEQACEAVMDRMESENG